MADEQFSKLYYSADGYWRGKRAIDKLRKATGKPKAATILHWLERQPAYQIFAPPPKYISRPKINEETPNNVHKADLLFLPEDQVGRFKYRYCLTVVDVASRYKAAYPLSNKTASGIAAGFDDIRIKGLLKWPKLLQVDAGKEFKGAVLLRAQQHGTEIRTAIPKNHRQQGIVERFNKTIAERLFTAQYHAELKNPSKKSKKWVKALPKFLDDLNNSKTRLTGLTPAEAIGKEVVESKPSLQTIVNTPELDSYVTVRYLYLSGELEKTVGERYRATDPIWSLTTHHIEEVLKSNDAILYKLGPDIRYGGRGPLRSFTRAELLVIPPDTADLDALPDYTPETYDTHELY